MKPEKLKRNFKEMYKMCQDDIVYGMGVMYIRKRKWYNPMRYIFGLIKLKNLDPRKIYIKK